MIQSMTGFGTSDAEHKGTGVSVTIRAVNGKSADVSIRVPTHCREKEAEIRSKVLAGLERGKIDVGIRIEKPEDGSAQSIDGKILLKYIREIREILKDESVDDNAIFTAVSRFPNVVSREPLDPDPEEWNTIEALLNETIKKVVEFRRTEGAELEKDLKKRIEMINRLKVEAGSLEAGRLASLRERIERQQEGLKGQEHIDRDRFEQEMIYYLERLDITEEMVRLSAHCKFFLETLTKGEGKGKKLMFIAQEMGREINTIGSKANHAGIQKIVVEMKDELEKIKEQLLNVL